MLGEAIVLLGDELAASLPYLRKQSMQLASKMRFVAAQFEALLDGELWRRAAGHANAMAARLAAGRPRRAGRAHHPARAGQRRVRDPPARRRRAPAGGVGLLHVGRAHRRGALDVLARHAQRRTSTRSPPRSPPPWHERHRARPAARRRPGGAARGRRHRDRRPARAAPARLPRARLGPVRRGAAPHRRASGAGPRAHGDGDRPRPGPRVRDGTRAARRGGPLRRRAGRRRGRSASDAGVAARRPRRAHGAGPSGAIVASRGRDRRAARRERPPARRPRRRARPPPDRRRCSCGSSAGTTPRAARRASRATPTSSSSAASRGCSRPTSPATTTPATTPTRSESHPPLLSRALTEATGRGTKELITDRVMLEAARLLRFTDLTVGEIAFRAGFADPLYFSRAFKRHTGDPR